MEHKFLFILIVKLSCCSKVVINYNTYAFWKEKTLKSYKLQFESQFH